MVEIAAGNKTSVRSTLMRCEHFFQVIIVFRLFHAHGCICLYRGVLHVQMLFGHEPRVPSADLAATALMWASTCCAHVGSAGRTDLAHNEASASVRHDIACPRCESVTVTRSV